MASLWISTTILFIRTCIDCVLSTWNASSYLLCAVSPFLTREHCFLSPSSAAANLSHSLSQQETGILASQPCTYEELHWPLFCSVSTPYTHALLYAHACKLPRYLAFPSTLTHCCFKNNCVISVPPEINTRTATHTELAPSAASFSSLCDRELFTEQFILL